MPLRRKACPPHHTRHENGGADEISVAGLSGELADPQPTKHVSGSAQITATNTYVDATHGYGSTPDINEIQINLQSDMKGRSYYLSNVGSTTFRINITGGANPFDSFTFGWRIAH